MLRLLNPILAVRQVCRPSRPDRVDDPAIRKVQVLRAVVGLLAFVWILVAYRLASDAKSVANERIDQVLTSAALLPATLPIVVGAFILGSRPQNRRMYLLRTLKPLGALLALGSAVLYFVLLASGKLTGGPIGEPPENPTPSDYALLMYFVFLVVLGLWVFVFLCYGIVVTLVHMLRAADIHEVLPPVIAIVLVWELAILDLFSNTYDSAPLAVRAALLLGGPLSVTLVGLWELRRLKARHGLTLRQALGR